MDFTYFLLLVTFLIFPVIGYLLTRNLNKYVILKYINHVIVFFAIHNILFFTGLSIRGDYADYVIFSIEYLFLCMGIFAIIQKNLFLKIIKIVGIAIVAIGVLNGMFGIITFIIISMDYETDRIFNSSGNERSYETRRYSFGFATLSNTRYTFETYRIFNMLPFEVKIDKTDFIDTKTDLNIAEEDLKIEVRQVNNNEYIDFISTNEKVFIKKLE